ncbi:MAG: DNA recombination protein RmuC [Chloroflexi bacterium]|nr:DNA recombination protein RmuC [Chloroflexota bacterium]
MEIVIGLIIGLVVAAGVYLVGRRELANVRDETTRLRTELGEAGEAARGLGEAKARAESDADAYQREAATRTVERDEALNKLGESEERLSHSESRLAGIQADHAARVEEMNTFRAELEDRFKGIASSVTQSTREDFIKEFRDLTSEEAAKSIERMDKTVEPLKESIQKLDKQSQAMEQVRQKAYGSVEEMIAGTGRQLNELNLTTTGLRRALSAPQQRGRWGELTLERVLEVSGMLEHVSYERQPHTPGEDGAVRPDAIIHMPRELTVPVDAKAPLSSYLEAHDAADDSQQRAALEQHARSLMGHARQLGSKSYAEAIEGHSPDFVVLFLPAETILDAAMTAQPSIWEDAWTRHRVLIATPGLLIALLRTIGVAWQQEEIQRNAQDIADAAKLLYERLGTFTKHVDGVGGALDRAVKAYNDSVGSLERRVLPQARRMEELGAVGDGQRIEEPRVLDGSTRQLNAPELNAGSD